MRSFDITHTQQTISAILAAFDLSKEDTVASLLAALAEAKHSLEDQELEYATELLAAQQGITEVRWQGQRVSLKAARERVAVAKAKKRGPETLEEAMLGIVDEL